MDKLTVEPPGIVVDYRDKIIQSPYSSHSYSIKEIEFIKFYYLQMTSIKHFEFCYEDAKKSMTKEKAELIRKLRIEDGKSWFIISSKFARCGMGFARWGMGNDDIMGLALCKAAAEELGEDYMSKDWIHDS